MRRIVIAAALVAMHPLNWAMPSLAQEAREMTPLDFMVEAPTLQGQRVRLNDVIIIAASFTSTQVKVPGGYVFLDEPFVDRADFRRLLPACESNLFEDKAACVVTVEGDVGAMRVGHGVLSNVDFIFSDDPQ